MKREGPATFAALRARAARNGVSIIDQRVTEVIANPRLLDSVHFGLSKQAPSRAKITVEKLISGELPCRNMPDELLAINLRAAAIYIHALCARDH
ncbi:MAG: hypothetical protein L0Y60_04305 [Beijerinckiaceae bacterium]|nr:hypothetical protein [Beijerinckiaceae bacterium]